MQMRKFLTAAAAATALFLTGCQTALEPAAISGSPEYWQQMQQKLAQVQTYNLSVRLGVSGETRFSANFNLQGTGDTYTLVLTSSLGSELAKLTVKPGEARLKAAIFRSGGAGFDPAPGRTADVHRAGRLYR